MFKLVLAQTVLHAFRKGGGAFGTTAFYIMTATLFIFALGTERMSEQAGAVMCVAMLLASMVALPLLYERDHEDGTLEQFLLQPVALELLVLAKILGQWLAILLPVLTVTPLLGLIAGLTFDQTFRAMTALSLASPTLIAIGSVTAAITIGARRGGLLQSLIALPLTIPLLVFAASGKEVALWFLASMLLASLPLACWISAALIRMSED